MASLCWAAHQLVLERQAGVACARTRLNRLHARDTHWPSLPADQPACPLSLKLQAFAACPLSLHALSCLHTLCLTPAVAGTVKEPAPRPAQPSKLPCSSRHKVCLLALCLLASHSPLAHTRVLPAGMALTPTFLSLCKQADTGSLILQLLRVKALACLGSSCSAWHALVDSQPQSLWQAAAELSGLSSKHPVRQAPNVQAWMRRQHVVHSDIARGRCQAHRFCLPAESLLSPDLTKSALLVPSADSTTVEIMQPVLMQRSMVLWWVRQAHQIAAQRCCLCSWSIPRFYVCAENDRFQIFKTLEARWPKKPRMLCVLRSDG